MELYPAVDVQGGRVARVSRGKDADADPLAVIVRFAAAGARWIHFVDLDRAYDRGDNRELVRTVFGAAAVPVQVGGGLRTDAAIDEMLAWGAARVVIGTKGAMDPALVDRLLVRHGPGRLAVAIDAKDARLAARGSTETFDVSPLDLARRVRAQGIRTVIYADVTRDGMLGGPDIAGARALAPLDLQVIASGGVASLDDLRAVRDAGLGGAIVGRALHEKHFTLEEALACVA
ncbi:MAG: 1-(5-phosphoribosyl)-5-[(5-phosphoribosylamino)methylideneamino] imidazole-4-carboxamide isomerase [Gemmatimonadales bacterium]